MVNKEKALELLLTSPPFKAILRRRTEQVNNGLSLFLLRLILTGLWGRKAADIALGDELFRRLVLLGARSVVAYGLGSPLHFVAPLMVVWNFTNACNLRCKHCYQRRGVKLYPEELSLSEKLDAVDQMADMGVAILAISGGEPLLSPHLLPVIRRSKERGMWTCVATNGTLLDEALVRKLADAGVDYIEVSLDSASAERHDRFRGVDGSWHETVKGIERAVKAGIDVGIASTITKLNLDELDELYRLAMNLGAKKFFAFNFVPTGGGRTIASIDLSPWEREEMLRKLYKFTLEGRIAVCATAPQFGRICHASSDLPVVMHYAMQTRSESAKRIARYLGGCGAGRVQCCLQPDGKVTPCVFIEDLVVGDLRESRFEEIWMGSEVFKALRDRDNLKGHCRTCNFREVCGGCRARAYAYLGDLMGPDPGCVFNTEVWEKLLPSAQAEGSV